VPAGKIAEAHHLLAVVGDDLLNLHWVELLTPLADLAFSEETFCGFRFHLETVLVFLLLQTVE
jgi:hypothetical protein